ncbi:sigma-70 family RNA polymerase sigma factor [Tautonia sociabilis]|uniref:Sigma-70 family RNA polymerase sigma factor n=1 Tax=Tautonia sociabilis TaxID=2080755 RepID=A0A432MJ50_9BACT|nr:sigma-70 family RNA polymerase sigma factor [Tautonia sociabilis]RUL87250.1 sigma-70 family RNA polymerase sigma factor [Tautonia sociabilis]
MRSENPRKERTPLTEAQQRLAVQYLPMARSLARPFKEQFPDIWEEFESAACMALVEAARSFEPARAVKFSTFARQRIWGGLCDVRRERLVRTRNECRAFAGSDGTSAPMEEIARDDRPVGADLEAVEAVESWLRKLPRQHAKACRLIYLEDKTHAEAAEILGYSPSRITYLHLESLAMLGDAVCPGFKPIHRRRARSRGAVPA